MSRRSREIPSRSLPGLELLEIVINEPQAATIIDKITGVTSRIDKKGMCSEKNEDELFKHWLLLVTSPSTTIAAQENPPTPLTASISQIKITDLCTAQITDSGLQIAQWRIKLNSHQIRFLELLLASGNKPISKKDAFTAKNGLLSRIKNIDMFVYTLRKKLQSVNKHLKKKHLKVALKIITSTSGYCLVVENSSTE
ncbi:hypothetical protein KA082_01060 [Candidatus Woesebacteria bacterium]|nr:hypothetical protein [Candidatus Woesebacteria bacterium]